MKRYFHVILRIVISVHCFVVNQDVLLTCLLVYSVFTEMFYFIHHTLLNLLCLIERAGVIIAGVV